MAARSLRRDVNDFIGRVETKMGRESLLAFPPLLSLVVTKRCNLKCTYCFQKRGVEECVDLHSDTFAQVERLLFRHVKQIDISANGEPFLNENLMSYLGSIRSHGIRTMVHTNGMLLDDVACESIVDEALVWRLGVSVDSANKQTNESLRIGCDHERVVSGIKLAAEQKRRRNRQHPLLSITCTVSRRNIEDVPDLIRQAKQWGVDVVSVRFAILPSHLGTDESLHGYRELSERVFGECVRVAKAKRIRVVLPQDGRACYMPWRFVKIDPDGSVRFCFKSWDNPIGNVMDVRDFKDVWNNPHCRLIRRTMDSSKPYFRNCAVCPLRNGKWEAAAHYKGAGRFEFDEDYEKTHGIAIPQPVRITCS